MGLPEGGIEGFLPSLVVDGPEDFGALSLFQNWPPNRSIALVPCHVEAVYHGHAASQVARGLHVDVVLGLLRDDGRVQCDGHGDRVRQRNSMLTGLFEVGFLGPAVAFDGEARLGRAKAEHMLDVTWVEGGVTAAEVPSHKFDRKSTAQNDLGCFGIAPDVVLGGRCHIPFATGRAAHDDAATDLGGDAGIQL